MRHLARNAFTPSSGVKKLKFSSLCQTTHSGTQNLNHQCCRHPAAPPAGEDVEWDVHHSLHFTSFPRTNEWACASRGRLSLSSSVSLLLLPPNLQLFWPYFVSLILVLPSFPNSIIIWWPSDLYSSISQDRSLEKGKYLVFNFFCALVQELGCFQRLVNSYFPILDGNQAREMVHWPSTLVALAGSRFDSSPQAPV